LNERLARLIDAEGPITVARYMAEANVHYYATRDPFGTTGDFTTAPEISQMFGELIGAWLADLWLRAGSPEVRYVELGPGRGTLVADALRVMRGAGLQPEVHFVETSPTLRAAQEAKVPSAHWHEDAATVPDDAPLLIVANEFFDALPARQLIATESGWRERLVTHHEGRFVPAPGPLASAEAIPAHIRGVPPGTVLETSPASIAVVGQLAGRIARSGGAALIVDYGHARTSAGETLQAVSKHRFAAPWEEPGERDLTVHVDFEALGIAAGEAGARVLGPIDQGAWLEVMGIGARSAALAKAAPHRMDEIAAARQRLTASDAMGSLFKVLAVVAPDWPHPAGFKHGD
jgi:SAM-dependent MidA family methyltransferase